MKSILLVCMFIVATSFSPAHGAGISSWDSSSSSSSGVLSFEMLGRGGLYSINYDWPVNSNVQAGAGFSTYSVGQGSTKGALLILPLYANYYFSTFSKGRLFVSAGANLSIGSSNTQGTGLVTGSGLAASAGIGYEFERNNFVFRAAPYIFVGQTNGAWFGLTLGYRL